ncbi:MAG: ABC transporter substrate-binding protein [Burkholderiaceae bacterium]|jgi:putative ABC transport system substrate-binding protein|nr:ABC transporter substrate-binding protein [Burkholderiaceae bacterium]
MQRRAVCAGVTGALAWPGVGRAQPAKRNARIAVLGGSVGMADPATMKNMVEPLRLGLRDLGWVEGRNLAIEWRFAEGQPQRLPALLAESIAAQPDVLVAIGPRPAVLARDATRTLPIVAVPVDDPVQMGLAESYARPGRNITGLSGAYDGILSRRLQLLKDLVPNARRVGILMNPYTLPRATLEQGVEEVRRQSGLAIVVFEARGPEDFDTTLAAMARDRLDGVLILADATFYLHRMRLGEWCTTQRLPSIWGGRGYLDGGGLASFQGDYAELFRRSASLIDKILKGMPPGEIAWEQSTKFELVLNLKAARALGLKLPQSVLVSADEVIE